MLSRLGKEQLSKRIRFFFNLLTIPSGGLENIIHTVMCEVKNYILLSNICGPFRQYPDCTEIIPESLVYLFIDLYRQYLTCHRRYY